MSEWSQEDDKQLLQLMSKGHSYQEIANMMVRSRSAIAGRAHRLRYKATPEVRKTLRRKVLTITEPQESFNLSLLDLKPNSCRWPSDEKVDGNTTFCGVTCVPGKSYCSHHTDKARRKY